MLTKYHHCSSTDGKRNFRWSDKGQVVCFSTLTLLVAHPVCEKICHLSLEVLFQNWWRNMTEEEPADPGSRGKRPLSGSGGGDGEGGSVAAAVENG